MQAPELTGPRWALDLLRSYWRWMRVLLLAIILLGAVTEFAKQQMELDALSAKLLKNQTELGAVKKAFIDAGFGPATPQQLAKLHREGEQAGREIREWHERLNDGVDRCLEMGQIPAVVQVNSTELLHLLCLQRPSVAFDMPLARATVRADDP